MKELFNNPKEEEYLSEFKQKIAQEMQADIERRRRDLERSRNGFIGAVAGIVLAFLVSWFLLLPHFGFQSNKEIPVIRRPILPVKIQPNDPGGMEIQNQDKTVYALVEKNEVEDTVVESLLPEPEQPKMPVISERDAIVSAFNVSENAELINAINTSSTDHVQIPPKLPVIDVQVVKTNEPLTVKEQQPAEKVAEKTAEKAVEKTIAKTAETISEKKVNTPKPVEQKIEKATPEVNKKADGQVTGSWCVQLMASNKKDAVEKGYVQLKKQYALIANLPYKIESSSDGLYRLKVGAYQTKNEAETLCAGIKNAGGSCLVKEK